MRAIPALIRALTASPFGHVGFTVQACLSQYCHSTRSHSGCKSHVLTILPLGHSPGANVQADLAGRRAAFQTVRQKLHPINHSTMHHKRHTAL